MKLDSEQQRQILLQLIDSAQFPGSARKIVNELANAIERAKVNSSPAPSAECDGSSASAGPAGVPA